MHQITQQWLSAISWTETLSLPRIGLITIYFSGGFRPKWQAEHEHVTPDYRIQSFEQIADIVRVVSQSTTARAGARNIP